MQLDLAGGSVVREVSGRRREADGKKIAIAEAHADGAIGPSVEARRRSGGRSSSTSSGSRSRSSNSLSSSQSSLGWALRRPRRSPEYSPSFHAEGSVRRPIHRSLVGTSWPTMAIEAGAGAAVRISRIARPPTPVARTATRATAAAANAAGDISRPELAALRQLRPQPTNRGNHHFTVYATLMRT